MCSLPQLRCIPLAAPALNSHPHLPPLALQAEEGGEGQAPGGGGGAAGDDGDVSCCGWVGVEPCRDEGVSQFAACWRRATCRCPCVALLPALASITLACLPSRAVASIPTLQDDEEGDDDDEDDGGAEEEYEEVRLCLRGPAEPWHG